ncbi:hypothetical protein [Candidatus Tisiphia endosymbiont of Hybos culiciformis]
MGITIDMKRMQRRLKQFLQNDSKSTNLNLMKKRPEWSDFQRVSCFEV